MLSFTTAKMQVGNCRRILARFCSSPWFPPGAAGLFASRHHSRDSSANWREAFAQPISKASSKCAKLVNSGFYSSQPDQHPSYRYSPRNPLGFTFLAERVDRGCIDPGVW
jgi:hypothetical protein